MEHKILIARLEHSSVTNYCIACATIYNWCISAVIVLHSAISSCVGIASQCHLGFEAIIRVWQLPVINLTLPAKLL
jgi:hypothetical protein